MLEQILKTMGFVLSEEMAKDNVHMGRDAVTEVRRRLFQQRSHQDEKGLS